MSNSSASIAQSIATLATTLASNQESANESSFTREYDPTSAPYLFQTNSNLETMPSSVIQSIKCKICPAPLGPEVANAQLVAVNNTIQKQANVIEQLETQVAALEKRYKINFMANSIQVDCNGKPTIKVGGNLSNVLLDFVLNSPPQGPTGPTGSNGSNGLRGNSGPPGDPGLTGYWGNIE